jgi:hypothetical protein
VYLPFATFDEGDPFDAYRCWISALYSPKFYADSIEGARADAWADADVTLGGGPYPDANDDVEVEVEVG